MFFAVKINDDKKFVKNVNSSFLSRNIILILIIRAGQVLESISVLIFILLLILVGKGFTITRGRISTSGSIKLTVFMCVYCIVYAVLFIYQAEVSET